LLTGLYCVVAHVVSLKGTSCMLFGLLEVALPSSSNPGRNDTEM
jgi:hypothetical protein